MKATASDPAGVLSDWSATSDHCSWRWVSCDGRGIVVAANISLDTGIAGELRSSIGTLSDLRILSSFDNFYGDISEEVWWIENLEVVDLEGNCLAFKVEVRIDFVKFIGSDSGCILR
ncbi:hypothetical protein HPP92_000790, partial [Vanilla planifolia]